MDGGSAVRGAVGLTILGLGEWFGYMQAPHALSLSPILLAFIGAMTATAYCAALAVMVQLVHKRSETAIRAGEERYRLLAENATDMITRHDEKGRVVFASLRAQQLFGEPAQKIIGDGLFERVHVADRPAYLTALSRCHANRSSRNGRAPVGGPACAGSSPRRRGRHSGPHRVRERNT